MAGVFGNSYPDRDQRELMESWLPGEEASDLVVALNACSKKQTLNAPIEGWREAADEISKTVLERAATNPPVLSDRLGRRIRDIAGSAHFSYALEKGGIESEDLSVLSTAGFDTQTVAGMEAKNVWEKKVKVELPSLTETLTQAGLPVTTLPYSSLGAEAVQGVAVEYRQRCYLHRAERDMQPVIEKIADLWLQRPET